MDLVAVPLAHLELGDVGVERHVAPELGELAVVDHLAEVLAELVADLALHLVDPGDQLGERAELLDPLGGGLLAHARDVGEVVAGVAAQGGEVGILLGGQAVLLDDGGGVETRHVADAAARHQQRDAVVHELEGVAVAGDDQHVHLLPGGPVGERGDQVVGLEAREREVGHAERVEHLEDQADLAAEVLRGLLAVGFVLLVRLVAEGGLRPVEADDHVTRPLIAKDVDQHRGEAVHRLGVLAVGRGEVRVLQRVERAVRERVPVQEKQAVACGGRFLLRHTRSLVSMYDRTPRAVQLEASP